MMIDNYRMPTYNELVEISNGELTNKIKLALSLLQAASTKGEDTTEKERIYRAFQEEQTKRLNLVKKVKPDKPAHC